MSRIVHSLAMGAFALTSSLSYASKNVAFNNITTSAHGTSSTAYSIDVNNDGIPDVIQDQAQAPGVFLVSLGRGNGSFTPAVQYHVPAANANFLPMAFADFNRDGKLDIAVAVAGSTDVYMFYGNGDGTFQDGVAHSIVMPPGQTIAAASIATADFNHDGKNDLVLAAASSSSSAVDVTYVLPGDGAGNFATPIPVFTAPAGQLISRIELGDFDSDNNADIALDYNEINSGRIIQTTIHVLYGDGTFNFTDQFVQGVSGQADFGAGYLDNDSHTDLYIVNYGVGQNGTGQLMTLYGSATGRSFDSYYYAIPASSTPTPVGGFAPPLALADFNDDDNQKDLVTVSSSGPGQQNLIFFLSNGTRGQFYVQNVALPSGWYRLTAPVVGDFNRDMKPDVAVIQSNLTGTGDASSNAQITAAINGSSGSVWSNCNYPPTGQGIYFCTPIGYSDNGVQVNVTAASYNTLRKIELWIDGQKISEQFLGWGHYAFFGNTFFQIGDGNHNGTIYAVDIDNHLQRLDFGFTAGQSYPCPIPKSEGLNICRPTSGGTYNSTNMDLQAAVNTPAGVNRIEVWIDGVKRFTRFNEPFFSTFLQVPQGNHRFDFYAIAYDGTKYQKAVYAGTSSSVH